MIFHLYPREVIITRSKEVQNLNQDKIKPNNKNKL